MDDPRQPDNIRAADKDPAAVAAAAGDLETRRSARLQDLYAAAVAEPHPLRANVRAATADLLEIAQQLAKAVKLATGAAPRLEQYATVMPAIDKLTLLHRQAMRYVQFECDWAADDAPPRGTPRRRPPTAAQSGEAGT